MPWEFHLDMARVVWDEIRHSEETKKHLEDLGGRMGMYPVVPGNFALPHPARPAAPAPRPPPAR